MKEKIFLEEYEEYVDEKGNHLFYAKLKKSKKSKKKEEVKEEKTILVNNKNLVKIKQVEEIKNKDIEVKEKPKRKKRRRKRISNKLWFDLRKIILEKNDYLCEECGSPAEAIHHIKPISKYPELQHDINNLEALCNKCHRNKHKDLPDLLFFKNRT